jgi:hypothetical protein
MKQLSREHTAQAAILSRGGGILAISGQIKAEHAQEIISSLEGSDAASQSREAIVSFIKVGDSETDSLLFATPVDESVRVILLYEGNTPFPRARREALGLRRILNEQDPASYLNERQRQVEARADVDIPNDVEKEALLPGDWMPIAPATAERQPHISASQTLVKEKTLSAQEEEFEAAPHFEPPSIPADWLPQGSPPSSALPFLMPAEPPAEPAREPSKPNDESQVKTAGHTFTAVLLPRLSKYALAGLFAEQLWSWVKDLSMAWGLSPGRIDIQPEYLKFTMTLPEDVTPARAVSQLAKGLSERIVKLAPHITTELPRGNFWAKRYLLVPGNEVGRERLEKFVASARN